MWTLLDDPDDKEWKLYFPAVQFLYNTAVHSVMISSSFTYLLCDLDTSR